MPDDFTHQGKSAATQWVNQTIQMPMHTLKWIYFIKGEQVQSKYVSPKEEDEQYHVHFGAVTHARSSEKLSQQTDLKPNQLVIM